MSRRFRTLRGCCRVICADLVHAALTGAGCAAAVSTFDSINHLLSPDAVDAAFQFTASALVPGGLFVFDVNTEEAYRSEWGKQSAVVEPNAALFVRGGYYAASLVGRTTITAFRFENGRQRTDVEVSQRCYAEDDLVGSLHTAGFTDISAIPAAAAGMTGDIAVGRVFVSARKS